MKVRGIGKNEEFSGFYKKFQIVTRFFLWKYYLRWAYQQALKDAHRFGIPLLTSQKQFSCLLCGVSGEITADEFISFVLTMNPKASIKIIDIGLDQIRGVQRLVSNKYTEYDIKVRRENALHLNFLPDRSIDWIETDGFLGFFDATSLKELVTEWKRILKKDGFITLREFSGQGFLGRPINAARIFLSKVYMKIFLSHHTSSEIIEEFEKQRFSSFYGYTPIPTFLRYCFKIKY